MNTNELKNIFSVKKEKTYGSIVKSLGGSSYQVVDSDGRKSIVDSNILWNPGSGVSIKDGVIIGTASNVVSRTTYQV